MRKLKIVSLLTFLFFCGCIPGKYITIDTLEPAEITFPPETRKVLVFNFSYLPSVDTSSFNEARQLKPREQYFVDTIVIRNVFNGLFSVLDNSPAGFLNDAPYYELRAEDTAAFLQPLGQPDIEHLCDTFDVDAVISFEYYGVSVETKTFSTIVYDEGYEYVNEADQAMLRVMLWRIYSRKEGMISERMMRDTLYWTAYGNDSEEARQNLPDIGDELREAFWYGGSKYGSLISPSWSDTQRAYFDITDMKGKDISLDESRLKEYALSGKKKRRAYKASYNLALYYEMNDSIPAAVDWIDKALQLRPEAAVAKYYQAELEKRRKSRAELEKQLEH